MVVVGGCWVAVWPVVGWVEFCLAFSPGSPERMLVVELGVLGLPSNRCAEVGGPWIVLPFVHIVGILVNFWTCGWYKTYSPCSNGGPQPCCGRGTGLPGDLCHYNVRMLVHFYCPVLTWGLVGLLLLEERLLRGVTGPVVLLLGITVPFGCFGVVGCPGDCYPWVLEMRLLRLDVGGTARPSCWRGLLLLVFSLAWGFPPLMEFLSS